VDLQLGGKKKLAKEVSSGILRSFESLIKVGNSLPSALDVLIQVEKGRNKRILEKVHYNITKLDLSVGKALEKEGVISDNEVFVIDKSTSALEAVNSILAIREFSGNFEKTMMKLFAFPMVAIVIGLLIAYFAQPTFHGMVNSLVEQVQVTKGIDVSGESDLMWYLERRDITMYILLGYISFVITLLGAYFYYLRYKPEVIYKVFPLKAYDEVPYILMLIYNLQKVGLDQVRVFNILKESSPRVGWVRLFDWLEREAIAGKMIHVVFEKYYFPKDVTLVLKSAEVSRTFWDNMAALIAYVQDANAVKHKNLTSMFGGASTVVGFLIILYFVAGLFMAMFSLQNLSMAMM
jgi:type II secretory pathway component PulF